MTVKSTATSTAGSPEAEGLALADRSCRAPGLMLFWGSSIWILAGALLGLLSSLKFHGPGMGSGEVLTYGRVYPAATFALIFGGLAQAGLGVMLWLMVRQSRTGLQGASIAAFSSLVWNVGILSGVVAILTGNSTGLEGMEVPRGVAITLLAAYLGLGLTVLRSFLGGRTGTSYISGWFLFAALFWFPWILTTAILFIHVTPGRGVFQYVISQWFAGNLTKVWLALIAYGASFYFVPKLSQKPLHSEGMAKMTFWLTLLFTSWAVVPAGAPVPAWIPGVSTLAALVSLVPVLLAVSNLKHSLGDSAPGKPVDVALRCFQISIPCLLIAGLLQALSAVRTVGESVAFTFFVPGLQALFLGGFVGLTLLGSMIFALPRVAGCQAGLLSQTGNVFKTALAAVGLLAVPLIFGGILQGAAANNALIPFGDAMNRAMPFLRLSTLGWLAAVAMAGLWVAIVSQTVLLSATAAIMSCLPGAVTHPSNSGKTSGVSA